jgi:hypothetical protein
VAGDLDTAGGRGPDHAPWPGALWLAGTSLATARGMPRFLALLVLVAHASLVPTLAAAPM